MHNTGCPFIGTAGGTQTVRNWTFSTTEKCNLNALVVADSLGHGSSATTIGNRWANILLSNSVKPWAVNSGPGDSTSSVLAKVNEIILIHPKYVLLQAGGNDVRFGVADATRNANYDSFVSQLTKAGIRVIHILAGADSVWDMTSWNARLTSTYTGTVDCFTPLWSGSGFSLNSAYDAGDGTHWNNAGHKINAKKVASQVPFVLQ
jgi:lysophospholipase L1-like esterase